MNEFCRRGLVAAAVFAMLFPWSTAAQQRYEFMGPLTVTSDPLKPERPPTYHIRIANDPTTDWTVASCGSVPPETLQRLVGDLVTIEATKKEHLLCPWNIRVATPGIGDFSTGGVRGRNNGITLRRRANGTIQVVAQPQSPMFSRIAAITSVTDAKVVSAEFTGAFIVHAGNNWTKWPDGTNLNRTDDVVQIVATAVLERSGQVNGDGSGYVYTCGIDKKKVLTLDGRYFIQGDGDIGKLCEETPYGLPAWNQLHNVQAIASNDYQGVAVLSDGSIKVWDRDADKQMNHPNPAFQGIVSVAAGDDFMLALVNDGTIVSWGRPHTGPPAGLHDVVAISTSLQGGMAAALQRDGTLVTWDPHK